MYPGFSMRAPPGVQAVSRGPGRLSYRPLLAWRRALAQLPGPELQGLPVPSSASASRPLGSARALETGLACSLRRERASADVLGPWPRLVLISVSMLQMV